MKTPKRIEPNFSGMSAREIEQMKQMARAMGMPESRWRTFMVWAVRMMMTHYRATGIPGPFRLPLHAGNSCWAAVAPDGAIQWATMARTRKECTAKCPAFPGLRIDRVRVIPQHDAGFAAFRANARRWRRSHGRPARKSPTA